VTRFLVVAALKEELAPLRRARRRGALPESVALLETGDGAIRAAQALDRRLSADEPLPDVVIITGFCGALVPSLSRGEVVSATDLISTDADPPARMQPDGAWTARADSRGARRARFCCSRPLVSDRASRAALHDRTGADVVDLESVALARVAAAHDRPFIVIRAITDSIDDELHPLVLAAMRPDGSVSKAAVIGAAILRPWHLPGLLRLAAAARRAAEAAWVHVSRLVRSQGDPADA